jgi:hypothetical protein
MTNKNCDYWFAHQQILDCGFKHGIDQLGLNGLIYVGASKMEKPKSAKTPQCILQQNLVAFKSLNLLTSVNLLLIAWISHNFTYAKTL